MKYLETALRITAAMVARIHFIIANCDLMPSISTDVATHFTCSSNFANLALVSSLPPPPFPPDVLRLSKGTPFIVISNHPLSAVPGHVRGRAYLRASPILIEIPIFTCRALWRVSGLRAGPAIYSRSCQAPED